MTKITFLDLYEFMGYKSHWGNGEEKLCLAPNKKQAEYMGYSWPLEKGWLDSVLSKEYPSTFLQNFPSKNAK